MLTENEIKDRIKGIDKMLEAISSEKGSTAHSFTENLLKSKRKAYTDVLYG